MLLFLLSLPVLAEGGLTITIGETATVKGGMIGLADIAAIQGDPEQLAACESINLGKAPSAGQSRSLTRQFIIFKLAQAGFKAGAYELEMPPQVRLTTDGIILTADRMEALLEKALASKAPAEWTSWKMGFPAGFNSRFVSSGELSVIVENGADPLTPGTNLLQVKVQSDGKDLLHMAMAINITATGKIPVLKEDIQRHSLILETAWAWEERTLTGSELMKVPAGKIRTTRRLRQGEVLDKNALEPVPLVEKGGKVLIIYHSGSAAVQTYGLAQTDGWLGQTVAVENMDSGKVIRTIVTGEGQVEVK